MFEAHTNLERAFIIGGIARDTLCIDGAATLHMVPHDLNLERRLLHSYIPFDSPREVIVGGGYKLYSQGTGTLVINGHELVRALSVQDLQFILISEPQIMFDDGEVITRKMPKTVYDSDGNVILSAPLDKDYRLIL